MIINADMGTLRSAVQTLGTEGMTDFVVYDSEASNKVWALTAHPDSRANRPMHVHLLAHPSGSKVADDGDNAPLLQPLPSPRGLPRQISTAACGHRWRAETGPATMNAQA